MNKVYCFTSTCRCPNGQNPFGVEPQSIRGDEIMIATTGLPNSGGSLLLSTKSIATACTNDAGADAGVLPTPTTIDPCLVGTWRLDTDHAKLRFNEKLAQYGVMVNGVTGGQLLEIRADRGFSHKMLPMIVSARALGSLAFDMTLELGGTSSGRAGSIGGTPAPPNGICRSRGMVVFDRTSGNIGVKYSARVGTNSNDGIKNLSEAVQPGSASYRVIGDVLFMTPNERDGIESSYRRQR